MVGDFFEGGGNIFVGFSIQNFSSFEEKLQILTKINKFTTMSINLTFFPEKPKKYVKIQENF